MKQMPVESRLAAFGSADLGGDAAHLRLLEFADGEERLRQLRLVQAVQEIALVLAGIAAAQELEAGAAVRLSNFADTGVVAGGDAVGAEAHRVVEKGLELDLGVAQHVGVGRAAGGVLAQEIGEHAVLVVGREVDVLDLDAQHIGHARRIEKILARRAVDVIVVVFPVLHEDADDLMPRTLQQPGGDGRIDAAGEADDDALLGRGGGGRHGGIAIVAARERQWRRVGSPGRSRQVADPPSPRTVARESSAPTTAAPIEVAGKPAASRRAATPRRGRWRPPDPHRLPSGAGRRRRGGRSRGR